MIKHPLDSATRKALSVHIGEEAARDLADALVMLAARVEQLERGKVDRTMVVPAGSDPRRRDVTGDGVTGDGVTGDGVTG